VIQLSKYLMNPVLIDNLFVILMLTASDLLACWEKSLDRPMFERALVLLEATSGQSWEKLAALSIGERDARLLDLREAIFGRSLPCLTQCNGCGERLELNLDISDLRVQVPPRVARNSDAIVVEAEGVTIEFRVPNSFDLSVASSAKDAEDARSMLLERCLVAIHEQGKEMPLSALSASVLEVLTEAMADADPQSHLELALTCPSCKQNWQAGFDIASYLWSEIQRWAIGILREVHILASAYGWREVDILALSPLRRQLYLNSVGAT
jgi:hypothetical protein